MARCASLRSTDKHSSCQASCRCSHSLIYRHRTCSAPRGASFRASRQPSAACACCPDLPMPRPTLLPRPSAASSWSEKPSRTAPRHTIGSKHTRWIPSTANGTTLCGSRRAKSYISRRTLPQRRDQLSGSAGCVTLALQRAAGSHHPAAAGGHKPRDLLYVRTHHALRVPSRSRPASSAIPCRTHADLLQVSPGAMVTLNVNHSHL